MSQVTVMVVWAMPHAHDVVTVTLPGGATVADALAASGVAEVYALDLSMLGYALRGRRVTPGTALREGDRVDITRPLVVDSGEARRRRAAASPLGRTARPPRREEPR